MNGDICAYWLSWADQNGPLGSAIITIGRPKNTYVHAIQRAVELGIVPGGNVQGFAMTLDVDAAFVNRLLTVCEVETIDEYLCAQHRQGLAVATGVTV